MSVNEQALQVNAPQMIQWAVAHERVAEACVTARADHPRTVAAAESWGPLFCEARRATVAAVNARETALVAQEERHRAMAQELRTGAARLEEMNAQNRANLTISTD
jgi:excreted virulence factor EspC (type VII ESX diderm)